MSRHAPIIPVDAKMYRHFAIATVMITATLAMFASGENREALEEQLNARQQTVALQQAEQKKAAEKGTRVTSNFTDKRKVKGSFSTDSEVLGDASRKWRSPGGFAHDTDAELVADDTAVAFSDSAAPSAAPAPAQLTGPPPPGMTPAEYAQMRNQKKKKQRPAPVQPRMTKQQVEAMMAASDARSRTQGERESERD